MNFSKPAVALRGSHGSIVMPCTRCVSVRGSTFRLRRCGNELTKSSVVLAPTCRSYPWVGARFIRHTHSLASMAAPYSRRARMPAFETTAQLPQRGRRGASGTAASSRAILSGSRA